MAMGGGERGNSAGPTGVKSYSVRGAAECKTVDVVSMEAGEFKGLLYDEFVGALKATVDRAF